MRLRGKKGDERRRRGRIGKGRRDCRRMKEAGVEGRYFFRETASIECGGVLTIRRTDYGRTITNRRLSVEILECYFASISMLNKFGMLIK